MATNVATTCLLLGFALLCGLQNIEGHPSMDPPMPGMRRAAEPMSAESDEMMDDTQGPPMTPVSPVGPSLNPLLPLIRMKPGKLVDPTQFIQMKAELLKNLLGPGGAKNPIAARYVARAVAAKGSAKWAGGAASWSATPPAGFPPGKWGAKTPKGGQTAAPAAPAQKSPWDWPPPAPEAPAAPAAPAPQAPAAPAAPMAPASWAPAPAPAPAAPVSGFPSVPGYWIPSNILPVPADPTDKKAALVEALLDNLLSQPMPPMQPMPSMNAPMRLARAPAASGPSAGLSEILDSLNLTVPAALPTLKPTIEPPGFWFPSYVPAAPGSLTPFVVDPTAQIAKKTKFLSDLFASKAAAAAALAAAGAASPGASLTTRGTLRSVDPSEYTAKVSTYIDGLLDSTSTAKRASGMAPTKKQMKTMKGAKASKVAAPTPAAAAAAAAPMMSMLMEEAAEDESEDQMMREARDTPPYGLYGLRKKREIEDETEADMTDDADPTDVAAKSAAILADMATVKQNILVQLDAMSKTEMAASKALKLAAKANKKSSTLAALLGIPVPTPAPVPTSAVTDFQPKIAVLTNIYSQLSDSLKNLTSAPDANDPLNPDKLFIAAVNARVTKIMMRNALLPTPPAAAAAAPKVARSSNSWQRWRGQQDSDAASQYEGDSETNRRQKSAVPLVAAVFAPQTTHYMSRQPNW